MKMSKEITDFKNFDWKDFYFNHEGRVNRRLYLINLFIPVFIINVIARILDSVIAMPVFSLIIGLAMIYPAAIVGIKRLHDLDKVGWFYLAILVPIVNLVLIGVLLFVKGTDGDNQFGPDPLK